MTKKTKIFDSIGPKKFEQVDSADLDVSGDSSVISPLGPGAGPDRNPGAQPNVVSKSLPKVKKHRVRNILFSDVGALFGHKGEKIPYGTPGMTPAEVQKVKKEKPKKDKAESKIERKPRLKHKVLIFTSLAIIFVFSIAAVGAAYAHQSLYKNRIFPGVTVWGEDVGGKNFDQLIKQISTKINNQKVEFVGPDQKYTATLADLGITFDTETMALSAYSKGRTSSFFDNYLIRARLLIAEIKYGPLQKIVRDGDLAIPPTYRIDEAKMNAYIDKMADNIKINPQDSKVTVAGGNISIVPAIFGREVVRDDLNAALKTQVAKFDNPTITIKTRELRPSIIDQAAQDVKVQTESVISRPVILTYQGQTFHPNKETVASWISYTKVANATNYTLIVDPAKMKNYFSFLESTININPINRKVRVENGVKETETQAGKDGLMVDEAVLGKSISAILPVQAQVNLEIPTFVAKYKTDFEQVIVADWEKYIDINISTQTMTAYTKGGNVVGSWAVTTGNDTHPTPIGTWLVIGKSAVTRMTGGTRGVDYYDLPNVHWVSWFKGGGFSIHEAYWRSSFGGQDYHWNGSHGCVNATLNVAHFIYDWAPIGTPVMVHY